MSEKYYLTTPIYYVNAAPHIGHAYTTIAADIIKRYKTMQGFHVVLTTGTDEHGQKVERSAKATNKSPEDFTTVVAEEFRQQWEKFNLSIDHFQRTSDKKHHETVQWLFQRCLERGFVYPSSYTGQYCTSCELYVTDAKAGDPCPDCGRPTETVTEENYFFKLSAFTDKLLELYDAQPNFIEPAIRRNEVLAFVKGGLKDLSISRTTIKWGIPVPVPGNHVFYVWFDALIAYMTAVKDTPGMWPADLHLIGKEIVRFHAIYWPAFLMAADLPLPKHIFAHGWLLFENDKMSKSRGNIVRAEPIREVMGAEALRYFLMREIVFGSDGTFSYDALVGRYNSDLANGLGNLASRTLSMIHQYRGGVVPATCEECPFEVQQAIAATITAYENFEFSKALEAIWGLISAADKFIVQQAPWTLSKKTEPELQAKLDYTLYASAEVVRIATVLLAPILPESAAKIWAQLGMRGSVEDVRFGSLEWGQLAAGQMTNKPEPVFMRIDVAPAIEKMRELEVAETQRQNTLLGRLPEPEKVGLTIDTPTIAIDDFVKVDLRVGQVLSAERVKGSDKLLHMKIDIGEAQPRTIVGGIAEAYTAEQMVGRKVVIVANLAPRKLKGIESQGMVVAASVEGGKPVLAGFLEDIPVGARLK